MHNRYYVYEKTFADPIADFASYDEAEAFVQTQKQADRQEGWYSSEYTICEGSDAVSAWPEV